MPTCSQPKCPIAATGVCLEGHTKGCPHLIVETSTQIEAAAETTPRAPSPPLPPDPYRFHSGEKLTAHEASRMLSARPVVVILLAGAQRAGKTTFLARIGEMFRSGAVEHYRFAGSKTLCAFERVTWLATIESGSGQPDTERTYRSEKDTFFHIQVQPIAKARKQLDILITDLPGEIFPAVLSSKEICDEQLSVARADHLLFFIDCESIVDSARRHSEKDGAYRFLSQIQKCRHRPDGIKVTVVFSRWDKIVSSRSRHEDEDYCAVIEDDIRTRFSTVFGSLHFERVAARPDPGVTQTDAEIQAIFDYWLDNGPVVPTITASRTPIPARDFCAFGLP
jgi:hypothetical protein